MAVKPTDRFQSPIQRPVRPANSAAARPMQTARALPSHFVSARHAEPSALSSHATLRASADASHQTGFSWNPMVWPLQIADRSGAARGLMRYGGVAAGIAAVASGGVVGYAIAAAAFYLAGSAMLARPAAGEIAREAQLGPRRPLQAHTSKRVALVEVEEALEPFGALHTFCREHPAFAGLALVGVGILGTGIIT